jgi:hypothetical protein
MAVDREHPSFWRQRSRDARNRAASARNPVAAAFWRWRARHATSRYDARIESHRAMLPGARR